VAPARTKVESDLEERIAACRGDGERVEILERARRFKASWLELAESLSGVLAHETYRRWGYGDFESYCKKELHLKRDTAYKLAGSYTFLKTRAPNVLRRDGMRAPIPPLDSVDFWMKAEEKAHADEGGPTAPLRGEALEELRHAVVDEGLPAGAIRRKYKEVFFPTAPEDEAAREARERKEIAAAATRLVDLIADSVVVPKGLAADVEEQLGRLVQELTA
jgi:hypothetical protein